jgi:hypothetical protein
LMLFRDASRGTTRLVGRKGRRWGLLGASSLERCAVGLKVERCPTQPARQCCLMQLFSGRQHRSEGRRAAGQTLKVFSRRLRSFGRRETWPTRIDPHPSRQDL